MSDMNELLNALNFAEFAETYMQTREQEWEEAGLDITHRVSGNGTPQADAQAKMLSEFAHSILKEADNMTILTLHKYHLWLIKKLSEILP